MIVSIIGLGLIGGSFAKAIKKYTDYKCYAYDLNQQVLSNALKDGAIDGILNLKNLSNDNYLQASDLIILCLYPKEIIKFARENINYFKPGAIVIDVGGVKTQICNEMQEIFKSANSKAYFIGTHPMAGREFSGYNYSNPDLFLNSSLIIINQNNINNLPEEKLNFVKAFANNLNFAKIIEASPEEHDRIIAYTSQLTHIVANAFVKSPTIKQNKKLGFSGGSFRDLTRVAKLNENMWSELMFENREFLIPEIKIIIENLSQYLNALESEDYANLRDLLREGSIIKQESEEN